MKPKLVIISDVIRRDLQQPLRYFSRLKIIHLYRSASYQDMVEADFAEPETIKWKGAIDLYRQIAKFKPVIVQGAEPWATKRSLVISIVTYFYKIFHPRVKLIIPVVENRPLKAKFSFPVYLFLRWWGGVYGRIADLVMYRNQGSKLNLLKCHIPAGKLKWVEWATWGIDCDEFRPQDDKTVDLTALILLFVGKVSVAKGVPWLLEAFTKIKEKHPKASLQIVGAIEDVSLSEIKQAGAEYLGVVKNHLLPDLYRSSDIVISPSITTRIWEEQVGMVNLQALACGVPVVSTLSGAIPEYVKDGVGAILVPEKDSLAIAQAVEKLLGDQDYYQKMSKLARRYVLENYEVKANIVKIEKMLDKLIGNNRSI